MTSDGVRIVYDDEGLGPPVVLVHGYSGERGAWGLQREALLDAGRRVIGVDQRNHGESGRTEFGQRVSRHGQDLKELIDALGLDDVALIGHSMGVSVCLAMFSLYGTDRVAKFIAIDQSPKMINEGDWKWGVRGLTWDNVREAVNSRAAWGSPEREHESPEWARVLHDRVDPDPTFSHEHVGRLLLDHFAADWRDVLPSIEIPTMVVTGRQSPFYDLEAMEWFAKQTGGSLSVFERSGHAPHVKEPAEFNRELLEFLSSGQSGLPPNRLIRAGTGEQT